MNRLDVKHIAYHVVVAVYFVWLIIFGGLIAMAVINALKDNNQELSRILVLWILFNLIMGTVLFLVIRLFRKYNILFRIVFYSYFFMVAAAITTVLLITT